MDKNLYSDDFLNMIFSSSSKEAKDALISLSKMLIKDTLKSDNAFIFFKILMQNNKEASDILFSYKSPKTFFSNISISFHLIVASIEILVKFKPYEIYTKNILCCLGVIENAYKNARSGFKIYALKVSDLQHISKYLILKENEISNIIIDILNCIWNSNDMNNKLTVLTAKEIIDGYFDNKKNIAKVLPHNLLI